MKRYGITSLLAVDQMHTKPHPQIIDSNCGKSTDVYRSTLMLKHWNVLQIWNANQNILREESNRTWAFLLKPASFLVSRLYQGLILQPSQSFWTSFWTLAAWAGSNYMGSHSRPLKSTVKDILLHRKYGRWVGDYGADLGDEADGSVTGQSDHTQLVSNVQRWTVYSGLNRH